MINRLTTAEAAERLGVKPETLYAYVSRGLLQRDRTTRGSTFDAREVARLARSSRHPSGPGGRASGARGRLALADRSNEPVFVTELTYIQDGHIYYRGLDAVELSRRRTFEEVAGWLWTGTWPLPTETWSAPAAMREAVAEAVGPLAPSMPPVERFMVATMAAALSDELRHDVSPAAVPVVGRTLVAALVESLPPARGRAAAKKAVTGSISQRLWPRLTRLPLSADRRAVLEAALVLVADHELAPSTLGVRVAAALRADPYAAVLTGLGPASGSWHTGSTGAPSEVETLLSEALASDPERAIGERLRRTGSMPHGFGMPLYPDGDPRGAELLSRLDDIDASPDRLQVVRRVESVARRRGFAPPNVDMGLGALAFCAEMVPGAGQAILTLGKVAGWLAHAMEEYANPTLFRSRADYVGSRPGSLPATL